jgi:hypothetical protein
MYEIREPDLAISDIVIATVILTVELAPEGDPSLRISVSSMKSVGRLHQVSAAKDVISVESVIPASFPRSIRSHSLMNLRPSSLPMAPSSVWRFAMVKISAPSKKENPLSCGR